MLLRDRPPEEQGGCWEQGLGSWRPQISPGVSLGRRRQCRALSGSPGDTSVCSPLLAAATQWVPFSGMPFVSVSAGKLFKNSASGLSPDTVPSLPCPAVWIGTLYQNLCWTIWQHSGESHLGCTAPWSASLGKGLSLEPVGREKPFSHGDREVYCIWLLTIMEDRSNGVATEK